MGSAPPRRSSSRRNSGRSLADESLADGSQLNLPRAPASSPEEVLERTGLGSLREILNLWFSTRRVEALNEIVAVLKENGDAFAGLLYILRPSVEYVINLFRNDSWRDKYPTQLQAFLNTSAESMVKATLLRERQWITSQHSPFYRLDHTTPIYQAAQLQVLAARTRSNIPYLYGLLETLLAKALPIATSIADEDNSEDADAQQESMRVTWQMMLILGIIAKIRSKFSTSFQELMGLLLFGSGQRSSHRLLNMSGILNSYNVQWERLRAMKDSLLARLHSECLQRYWHFRWQWDNINIQHLGEMNNWTVCVMIDLQNIPWPPNIAAFPKKMPPSSLKLSTFQLSPAERVAGAQLFVQHVMGLATTYIADLMDLRPEVPQWKAPKGVPRPTNVHVLPICKADENTIEGTIEVLHHFAKHAGLRTEMPSIQTVLGGGDWVSVNRGYSAQDSSADEENRLDELGYLILTSDDFHLYMNVAAMVLTQFWGQKPSPSDLNLGYLVSILDVPKQKIALPFKNFNANDDLLDKSGRTLFLAAFLTFCGQKDCDEAKKADLQIFSVQDLEARCKAFLSWLWSGTFSTGDAVFRMQCSMLHAIMKYSVLRMCGRYGYGEQLVRFWKSYKEEFLGSGRHGYAMAAVNLVAAIETLPAPYADKLIHDRFVNLSGVEGGCIPHDQLVEHIIRETKNAISVSGQSIKSDHPDVTAITAFEVTKIIHEFELGHALAEDFKTRRARSSKKSRAEIIRRSKDFVAQGAFKRVEGRESENAYPEYQKLGEAGMHKWLGKALVSLREGGRAVYSEEESLEEDGLPPAVRDTTREDRRLEMDDGDENVD